MGYCHQVRRYQSVSPFQAHKYPEFCMFLACNLLTDKSGLSYEFAVGNFYVGLIDHCILHCCIDILMS